jgi:riboflavin biosynthesis pyrimidine reductase
MASSSVDATAAPIVPPVVRPTWATIMFARLDLIDEYRPVVHPVILGGGKPMFPALDKIIGLRLIETRRFGGGAILLRYQRIDQT